MLDKITVTTALKEQKSAGRKPAKLTSIDNVISNIKKFNVKKTEIPKQAETPNQTDKKNVENKVTTEKNDEMSDINYPSADECQRRLDNKMAEITKVIKINKNCSARRIKGVARVPKMIGHVYRIKSKDEREKTPEKPAVDESKVYDFSKSIEKMNETAKEEIHKEVQEDVQEKPYSWLRNEETAQKTLQPKEEISNDENNDVVEYQTLVEQKETTADSLATQKEILMNLRKQVEQNNRLCEAKKRDLIEENMALTQELNDVLAEINRLSDTVNQQEAFLGISEEEKTR